MRERRIPMLVPVLDPLTPSTVWEHTPLNPYRGEYPRFIRPIGAHAPRTTLVYRKVPQ